MVKLNIIGAVLLFLGIVASQQLFKVDKEKNKEGYSYYIELNGDKMGLTDQQFSQLTEFFSQYDTDKDGFMIFQEVLEFVKQTNPSPDNETPSQQEVQDFINLIDRNTDGKISFNEFLTLGFLDGNDQKDPDMSEDFILESDQPKVIDL